MYLPLISVVALATVGLFSRASKNVGLTVVVVVTSLLGWSTIQRDRVYRSAVSLWSDTVGKCPGNTRAYNELANAFDAAGRNAEALANYDKALQLKPDYARAWYNKGELMLRTGHVAAALELFDQALRINPAYFKALKAKGDALVKAGRSDAPIAAYEEALKLQPAHQMAIQILGASACYLKNETEAKSAFNRLPTGPRNLLRSVCQKVGINL